MTMHSLRMEGMDGIDWFALGFHQADIAMGLLTPEGRWQRVNPALCRLLGYGEPELIGLHFKDITPPGDWSRSETANRSLTEGRAARIELEKRYIRRDGAELQVLISGSPVRGADGGIRFFLAVIQDVGSRKRMEKRLQESEERYRVLTEESPEPLMVHRDGIICYMNRACKRIGGLLYGEETARHAEGKALLEIVHPGDRAFVGRLLAGHACRSAEDPQEELRLTGTTGRVLDIEYHSIPVRYGGRNAIRTVFRDITRRKEAERRARVSEARYRSLMAYHLDAVYAFDLEGRFTEANPVCYEISGYRPEELIGRPFGEIVCGNSAERASDNFRKALSGEGAKMELAIRHKNGHPVDIQISSIPIVVDGEVIGVYGVAKDITEQKRAELSLRETNRLLRDLSLRDGLTELPNRRRFDELYAEAWTRADAGLAGVSLIALDIDRFKAYNDYYGHLGGDDCLKRVAAAIREEAQASGGTAARYGGEEFMIVLPDVGIAAAAEAAERIRCRVEALGLPHAGREPAGAVTISIGVAGKCPGTPGERSALIEQADRALYRSKLEGRNRVTVYSEPRQ